MNRLFVLIWMVFFVFGSLSAQIRKPVKSVPEAGKLIALTFDDGIEPAIHRQLLKVLKKEGVSATFFMLGKKLAYKDLIKQTLREGHEIGNHTMNHPLLPKLTEEEVENEILGFQHLMLKEYGYTPHVFRAPNLQYDDRVFTILNQHNLVPINANIGTRDYAKETTREDIYKTATNKDKLEMGNIILMHEMQKTADVLPRIVQQLKKEGYAFCTVSQLLAKSKK